MRLIPVYLSLTTACLVLTIGFSNCSKVGFDAAVTDSSSTTLSTKGGAVLINNGNLYTNDQNVTLSLLANSKEMLISNDQDCSTGNWETYGSFKQWTLSSQNAQAKVYAKFREKAGGQETDCVSDDIIHDNIAPVIDIAKDISGFSNKANVAFEFSATDNLSGIDAVDCSTDATWTTGCNSAVKMHTFTEGGHFIRLSARDKAGNVSVPRQSSILVDLTAPTVIFNQTPPSATSDPTGLFAFVGTDALSGVDKYECKSSVSAAWATCASPSSTAFPDGQNSFSVRVYDRAGNLSPEISYSWLIDHSVPSVRIISGPAPVTNLNTATFTFDGKDGLGAALTRFECSRDGAAYASCTSPTTYAGLTEGTHTFAVRGYNAVGTVSAPANYNWMIDTTKPTVTITQTPTNPTNSSTGTFVFTAQDSGSGIKETQCMLDGSGYTSCTSPKSYLNLMEGNHTFTVRAIDNAGNVGDPASYTYRIDLTKPEVTIVSGPAAQVKDMNATLVFTATDGAGQIASIECQIDAEQNFTPCSSPKTYQGLSEGTHIFRVRATDTVGLVSDVKTHTWLIDTLPPAINFGQTPPASLSTNTPSSIQYTVVDAGVGVDTVMCGFNNVLAACPASDQKTYPTFAVGDYTFKIVATDRLGNTATQTIAFTVTLKTQAISQNVAVQSNNKVDVLVVIDNSGSMREEQTNMAARFGNFLDRLQGLDWQLAIVTTDVASNAALKDGRLVQIKNKTNYILTSAMDLATAKADFAATIQRPISEGSGNEQGIAATYRSIQRSQDPANAVNTPNVQFFRSGAALSVLVVTDADETNPSGTQTQNMPQSLINLVNSSFPGKRFKYNSIIVKPGDTACATQPNNEGPGYSYDALSKLTGGVIGTVCSQDYSAQLTEIASATVDLISSVDLTCAPLDTTGDGIPDVQIITADGSIPPTYTVSGLKLNLSRVLPAGANQVKYTCVAP